MYKGQDNLYLCRSRLVPEYAQRGQAPCAFRVELETRSGEQLSATARIVNAFNISHQERNKQGYHYFCATEYRCAGQPGYGHSNFYWRDNENRPGDWTVEREE